MFERYTERARRVIFFGRLEASNFGGTTIETEHLLLGLIQEDKNLIARFQREGSLGASIREELKKRGEIKEKVSTSVDLPLSIECKRILAYAAEEAERLNHRHIGTEHLLLGMLREERCVAAQILHDRGLSLDAIRAQLAGSGTPGEASKPHLRAVFSTPNLPLPATVVVPDADTAKRIAEVVWTPVYGAEKIESQKPLTAELRDNVWTVIGSSPPETALFVRILETDGRILSMARGTGRLHR